MRTSSRWTPSPPGPPESVTSLKRTYAVAAFETLGMNGVSDVGPPTPVQLSTVT